MSRSRAINERQEERKRSKDDKTAARRKRTRRDLHFFFLSWLSSCVLLRVPSLPSLLSLSFCTPLRRFPPFPVKPFCHVSVFDFIASLFISYLIYSVSSFCRHLSSYPIPLYSSVSLLFLPAFRRNSPGNFPTHGCIPGFFAPVSVCPVCRALACCLLVPWRGDEANFRNSTAKLGVFCYLFPAFSRPLCPYQMDNRGKKRQRNI